ncbi:MAG: phage tail tip lysozyme [Hyphomicrobiales bacterium]
MADRTQLFRSKAPWIMKGLMREFGLTINQAAGILGNIGHECNGFHQMQEGAPIGGGRGGYGWCQWTGPRRIKYENYARQRGLSVDSDKANFGYLVWELQNDERGGITAVKQTDNLKQAVRLFERNFERANPKYKHYESRDAWATVAVEAYQGHSFELAETVYEDAGDFAFENPEEAAAEPNVAAAASEAAVALASAAAGANFARKLVDKANAELSQYSGLLEHQSPLKERIGIYWAFLNRPDLDGSDHSVPWSAAFISYMIHLAGAGTQFPYSTQHSQYFYRTINDRLINKKSSFWGYPVGELEIAPGDVLGMNRASAPQIEYDWASHHSDYKSHSDIVVSVDGNGVHTIGGNVGTAPGQINNKTFVFSNGSLINRESQNQRAFVVIRSFLP